MVLDSAAVLSFFFLVYFVCLTFLFPSLHFRESGSTLRFISGAYTSIMRPGFQRELAKVRQINQSIKNCAAYTVPQAFTERIISKGVQWFSPLETGDELLVD